jgi:hypothetical protein
MPKIDLHMHSHYSDGQDSPEYLDNLIEKEGGSLFSITDHNYIYPKIKELVVRSKANFLQGIEVSSMDRVTSQSLHILGYSNNFNISALNEALYPVVNGYNERAKMIIKELNSKFNCDFSFETIKKELFSVCVSRNVLAMRLVEFTGNKMSIADAVKECFVQEENSWMPDASEVIKLINNCGGVAVLAHPGNLFDKIDLPELVSRLIDVGLGGIEVYYARHSQETIKELSSIAMRYDVLMTGGSDWHGKDLSKFAPGVEVSDIIYNMCISRFKTN